MCICKTLCAVPEREREREICVDYIVYLFREILVTVECCLYIIISNKYGNKTCILSMLARQVHVVYAYVNKGLFLTMETMRIICSYIFSLKEVKTFKLSQNSSHCCKQYSQSLLDFTPNVRTNLCAHQAVLCSDKQ